MVVLRSGFQTSHCGEERCACGDQTNTRPTAVGALSDVSADGLEVSPPPSSPEHPISRVPATPTPPSPPSPWQIVPCTLEGPSAASQALPPPAPLLSSFASANRFEILSAAPDRTPNDGLAITGPRRPSLRRREGGRREALLNPLTEGRGSCAVANCPLPRGQDGHGFTPIGLARHTTRLHRPTNRSRSTHDRVLARRHPTSNRRPRVTPQPEPTDADWAWADSQGTAFLLAGARARRIVPARLKGIFIEAAEVVLQRAATGHRGAWWLLLALPRLALPVCPPGVDKKAEEWNVSTLLRLFRDGHWQRLFDLTLAREEEARRLQPLSLARPNSTKAVHDRAASLMAVGEYSRAQARLMNASPATSVDIEALRALHPSTGALSPSERSTLFTARDAMLDEFAHAPRDLPDGEELQPGLQPFKVSAPTLQRALGSAGRLVGGGPSGWVYEHLKVIAGSERAFHLLLGVINTIAQGSLPSDIAETMSASLLLPIPKEDGSIRPIAMGDIFSRLAMRCACFQLGESMEKSLAPHQYGVSCKLGAELMVHTIEATLHQNPSFVMAGFDISNAFNCVNRFAMLRLLSEQPGALRTLFPMVLQLYGTPAPLIVRGTDHSDLLSSSGTRQGCPLSSYLFALAIQPVLKELHVEFDTVMPLAFADDIRLIGPAEAVQAASRALLDKLGRLNLQCNTSKCWLLNGGGRWRTVEDETGRSRTDVDGSGQVPPDTPPPAPSAKTLGAFFGPNAESLLLNSLHKPKALAAKLRALKDFAHAGHQSRALQLLLVCAAPSVNYALRINRPSMTRAMAIEADQLLSEALSSICGLEGAELLEEDATATSSPRASPFVANSVLHLPQRLGGVGLTSAVTLWESAYAASWASSAPLIMKRWPGLTDGITSIPGTDSSGAEKSFVGELAEQLTYCSTNLGQDLSASFDAPETPTETAPPDDTPSLPQATVQKRLASAVTTKLVCALKNKIEVHTDAHPADLGPKIWYGSLVGTARSAFLHCVPTRGHRPLSGDELQFAMRRLLRLPLRQLDNLRRCSCGTPLDPFGDHADACPDQRGERSRKHDFVNEHCVYNVARSAGLHASIEQGQLIPGTQYRPADTCIRYGHGLGDGLIACYDVVQTGNTAPSNETIAARYPGAMLDEAFNRKVRALARRSAHSNLISVPLPFDSQGALHETWVGTYENWAHRYTSFGPNATLPDQAKARLRGAFVRRALAATSLYVQRSQFLLVQRMCRLASARVHGTPRAARLVDVEDLGCSHAAYPACERGLRVQHNVEVLPPRTP